MKAESAADARQRIDAFHDLYYNGLPGEGYIFQRTSWMGVPCLKCPFDLWTYQEILHQLRPGLVIETGTDLGGSALFIAHMMDLVGYGEVVSIDIAPAARPVHPRIRYVLGSSIEPSVIAGIVENRPEEVRMVILDSDHSEAHVSRELELLSPHVTVGSYLIVEDTNINGHPTYPTFGPGPWEAVQAFLRSHPEFVVDNSREKFLLTFNPGGFLKRVA
jgi:cephalosporin hydroxylase